MRTVRSQGSVDDLVSVVGSDNVVVDPQELRVLSVDLSMLPSDTAAAAVRPGSLEELVEVVRVTARTGMALAVRAGATSYTLGHSPARADTVLVDLRRMNRVLEVNAMDRYAVVEAGCTWKTLADACAPHGLRPAFRGPLSGYTSTVGGAVAHNAVFHGSARCPTIAEAVVSLTVVLADGSVVRTGTAALAGQPPYAAWFGPDLAGMFIGDCGALGIKAHVVLELVPAPEHVLCASFFVPDRATGLETLQRLAGPGIATDLWVFDAFYHRLLAEHGHDEFAREPFSVHALVPGADEEHAKANLAALVRAVGPGIRAAPIVAAELMRDDPYGAMRVLYRGLGRSVHLPVNVLVPWSRSAEAAARIEAFLDLHADELERYEIGSWSLMLVAGSTVLLEPALWFRGDYHDESVMPEARAALIRLRAELARGFDDLGATHMQLARYYAVEERLEPAAWDALVRLKRTLDPDGRLTPGALGLG